MHKEKPRNQLFRPVSLLLSVFTLISVETRSEEGFKLLDLGKKQLDIQIAGKTVGRYMFAHDPSTSQNLHQTYKPVLKQKIDEHRNSLQRRRPVRRKRRLLEEILQKSGLSRETKAAH